MSVGERRLPASSGEGAEAPPGISLRGTFLAGLLVVAVTFGGFGTWAAVAPLASAVVAEGVFKVSSERKEIQHPEGGVVREILVDNGDAVVAEQVLIRLDDTQAQATLDTLRVAYDGARARVARLEAEKSRRATIRFPEDLVEQRESSEEIAALLRNEEEFLRARQQALSGTVSIIGEKIVQLQQQMVGVEVQLEAKKREVALARDELAGLQELLDDGLVEKTRVLTLEREIARLDGEVGVLTSERARLATQTAEEELNIVQLYNDMREEVAEELRTTNTQLADLEARMRDARYTLTNTVVRAPADGIVMELAVHTLGGVIQPGETVLHLVPAEDALVIEARFAPADIDNLRIGQPAQIQLVALKQQDAPVVEGKLVYLSADRITDEATGQSFYLGRIEVTPASLAPLDGRELLAGMPANVLLATGERTALQYLSQPIVESLQRAWREE